MESLTQFILRARNIDAVVIGGEEVLGDRAQEWAQKGLPHLSDEVAWIDPAAKAAEGESGFGNEISEDTLNTIRELQTSLAGMLAQQEDCCQ